jgi:uncharacterized coiled-coil DUF342 family protein
VSAQQDKLATLLADIDRVLGEAPPRLPWIMSSETNQQRQLLAKSRNYLEELRQAVIQLQETQASTPMSETSQLSHGQTEAEASQVLQALLQEMQYLRGQTMQIFEPLRAEVATLRQQRKQLVEEVKQLQQQRLEASQNVTPQLSSGQWNETLQQLTDHLEAYMATQLERSIQRLEASAASTYLLTHAPDDGAQSPTPSVGELSPAQRLEYLKQIQEQSDQLVLNLDKVLRTIFDSLQQSIYSYQDSLHQGLNKMHTLGQQGEMMFKALINHLAQQVNQDTMNYLQAGQGESGRLRGLPEVRRTSDTADVSDAENADQGSAAIPETDSSTTEESKADWDLEELDLDIDFEDDEITLLQIDDEISQLQGDRVGTAEIYDPTQEPRPAGESVSSTPSTLKTDHPDPRPVDADQPEPLKVLEQLDDSFPDPDPAVSLPEHIDAEPAAALATDTSRETETYGELDALYQSLFGDLAPTTSTAKPDIDVSTTEETANVEDITPEFSPDDFATELSDDLSNLVHPETEQFEEAQPLFSEAEAVESSANSTEPADLDNLFGTTTAEDSQRPSTANMAGLTINSLDELLPENELEAWSNDSLDTTSQALDDFDNLDEEDRRFIPAAPEEDLLAPDTAQSASPYEFDFDDSDLLSQLSDDLSDLESDLQPSSEVTDQAAIEGPEFSPKPIDTEAAFSTEPTSSEPVPTTDQNLPGPAPLQPENQTTQPSMEIAAGEFNATLRQSQNTPASSPPIAAESSIQANEPNGTDLFGSLDNGGNDLDASDNSETLATELALEDTTSVPTGSTNITDIFGDFGDDASANVSAELLATDLSLETNTLDSAETLRVTDIFGEIDDVDDTSGPGKAAAPPTTDFSEEDVTPAPIEPTPVTDILGGFGGDIASSEEEEHLIPELSSTEEPLQSATSPTVNDLFGDFGPETSTSEQVVEPLLQELSLPDEASQPATSPTVNDLFGGIDDDPQEEEEMAIGDDPKRETLDSILSELNLSLEPDEPAIGESGLTLADLGTMAEDNAASTSPQPSPRPQADASSASDTSSTPPPSAKFGGEISDPSLTLENLLGEALTLEPLADDSATNASVTAENVFGNTIPDETIPATESTTEANVRSATGPTTEAPGDALADLNLPLQENVTNAPDAEETNPNNVLESSGIDIFNSFEESESGEGIPADGPSSNTVGNLFAEDAPTIAEQPSNTIAEPEKAFSLDRFDFDSTPVADDQNLYTGESGPSVTLDEGDFGFEQSPIDLPQASADQDLSNQESQPAESMNWDGSLDLPSEAPDLESEEPEAFWMEATDSEAASTDSEWLSEASLEDILGSAEAASETPPETTETTDSEDLFSISEGNDVAFEAFSTDGPAQTPPPALPLDALFTPETEGEQFATANAAGTSSPTQQDDALFSLDDLDLDLEDDGEELSVDELSADELSSIEAATSDSAPPSEAFTLEDLRYEQEQFDPAEVETLDELATDVTGRSVEESTEEIVDFIELDALLETEPTAEAESPFLTSETSVDQTFETESEAIESPADIETSEPFDIAEALAADLEAFEVSQETEPEPEALTTEAVVDISEEPILPPVIEGAEEISVSESVLPFDDLAILGTEEAASAFSTADAADIETEPIAQYVDLAGSPLLDTPLVEQTAVENFASAVEPEVPDLPDAVPAVAPPAAETNEQSGGEAFWFLGLDIGTTGMSAVLLNQVAGQVYPLYWIDGTISGVTADKFFRLPTIASVVTAGSDYQVQSVGSAALTVNWEDMAVSNSIPEESVLLKTIKPLLKLGIPAGNTNTVGGPQIQLTESTQLPLQVFQDSLQALLSTLPQSLAPTSTLTVGAVGLDSTAIAQAFQRLQGVIISYPANWPDTYTFNVREAVLASGLVQRPDDIYFLEDAIAAVLSGLPDPSENRDITDGQPIRQQTLYACNWTGGTVVISAGATVTEMAVLDLPLALESLSYEDFALHSMAYAGDAIDIDIICHLLNPPERRQSRQPDEFGNNAAQGWNWQANMPELDESHWQDLDLDNCELPRPAEPDTVRRQRVMQRLESSLLGQSILEAVRHLKIILQHQPQFELGLADQRWIVRSKDLEDRIILPYIQRINGHLNRLLSEVGLNTQGINQVICTGGSASLPKMARWLRQKFPNATIVQDTYHSDRPPSCSRVAYGLVNLARYPQVLELNRHQYSDMFLLMELLRTFPDQPMPLNGILHLLEERGINIEACELHLIALLEGRLPPGLLPPAGTKNPLVHIPPETAEAIRNLNTTPLFSHPNNQVYVPNRAQCQRLQTYLEQLLAAKGQTLIDPLLAKLTTLVV